MIRHKRKRIHLVYLLLLTIGSVTFLVYQPLIILPQSLMEVRAEMEALEVRPEYDIKELRMLVRPEEDTVLLEPWPQLCEWPNLKLVIGVFTAPVNFRARSAIR